jgi:hypothetical protein
MPRNGLCGQGAFRTYLSVLIRTLATLLLMDHRQAAREHVQAILTLLESDPQRERFTGLRHECESLVSAIAAFHLEAIRFRMFNVDRILAKGQLTVPDGVTTSFNAARRELEAAGFHTRSHQAPS